MDRLNVLQCFVRVVELGSFSAAARELGVGQSTISKWIAALETELGAQLIERSTRSQRVTAAGERFAERARDIVNQYADAAAEVADGPAGLRGRIRVSVPVVFGQRYLFAQVAAFVSEHPETEVDLVASDAYVKLLDEGFDVAVRVGTPVDSSLRARQLGSAKRELVAAPAYLAARGRPRNPSALQRHECLLHTGVRRDTWVFEKHGKKTRASVRGRITSNNSDAIREMAVSGLGVALLANWLVAEDLAEGNLVRLLPTFRAPVAAIHALMPPGRWVHPRVRAFVDHLVLYAREYR